MWALEERSSWPRVFRCESVVFFCFFFCFFERTEAMAAGVSKLGGNGNECGERWTIE